MADLLCNHAPDIAAMDLFVVPTIGFDLLYAFVIVRLDLRNLVWINVTANPTAEWVARQITEAFPWDEASRHLIRDRDRIYRSVVTRRLRAMGIRDKPTAPASPWQNAFAERLIGSIRCECLDHIVVFGEVHLRRILRSYAHYYNEIRTHRLLEKMRRSLVRFSAPESSVRTPYSADFTITTSEFRFLVHTAAVAVIKKLLAASRDKEIPVIYTSGLRRGDAWDQGAWAYKNRRVNNDYLGLAPATMRSNIIVPDISPSPRDLVIGKQKPSAFHGTPLMDYLIHLRCDSLLVTGTTTSGCVRATVVDAFSANYRVTVVEDGCADRSQASHAINLCDLNAKYADVVASPEVIDYINQLPDGLFDLPKGDPDAARLFAPDPPPVQNAAE